MAKSTAELPKGTLGLLSAVVNVGVVRVRVEVETPDGAARGRAAAPLTPAMLATASVVNTKMAAP